MTVREILHFFAALKGCASGAGRRRLAASPWVGRACRQKGRGAIQRHGSESPVHRRRRRPAGVGAARRAVQRPGPGERRGVARGRAGFVRSGTTIVFSTHDMSVAERMCDFILMIHRGQKVLDGTLEEIQDAHGSDTIRVRITGDGPQRPARRPARRRFRQASRIAIGEARSTAHPG